MDFKLYGRVLWRFRLIVALGFVLAVILATLSVVRIGPGGISYRESQLWATSLRLLVTQTGFPEGRLYAQEPTNAGQTVPTPGDQASRLGIPIVDPARFNSLAILYAELATSDPVRRVLLRAGPVRGQITATALRDEASGISLPMIDLVAISNSAHGAVGLARRSAAALNTYVASQQRSNNVPTSDRVVVRTIVAPRAATVYQPRSKTMAIVVFLAVMLASIGAAFVLENLKPRLRMSSEVAQADFERSARRTA